MTRAKARRRGAPRIGAARPSTNRSRSSSCATAKVSHTHIAVLPDLTAASIARDLLPVLGPEVILCGDTAHAVTARRAGQRHEPVNLAAGERDRDGVFHIQGVNAHDSRASAASPHETSPAIWHGIG